MPVRTFTIPLGDAPEQGGTGRDADLPPPRLFRYDRHTWGELTHLLTDLPTAVFGFAYVLVSLCAGTALAVTVVGLPLLALGLTGARALSVAERARARGLLGMRMAEPGQRVRGRRGTLAWIWARLRDPLGWRSMLYGFIRLPWAIVAFVLTVVASVVLWPVSPYVIRALADADRAMVRGLLAPSDLQERIAELESDRGVVVDTAAADLRRIERDLHDGAQARLVNLAMGLGLAREKLQEDPEAAAAMVEEAHGEVKLALQELRDLARGIHPAVLTDRGLDAALSSVAARCTVPVQVTVDLGTRPAPAIEGIAYFTVSELLQNVSKHSKAGKASVEVWRAQQRLLIQVRDDGVGGATLSGGSGMAGLADRLGAVDGLFVIDSPAGGPTVVTAELPWRDRDPDRKDGT